MKPMRNCRGTGNDTNKAQDDQDDNTHINDIHMLDMLTAFTMYEAASKPHVYLRKIPLKPQACDIGEPESLENLPLP